MKVTILSPRKVIFEGEAKSVFVPGDEAEFELLDYHAPILSLLVPGMITLDWERQIPVERGIVKCENNECVILVEESLPHRER